MLAISHELPIDDWGGIIIVLFCLCVVTFFAIFLGFGSQLIAMVAFYFLISLWFHFYRYQYVRRGDQFTMPWPKPQGY